MAKLLQPSIASDITRIGLEKNRGLWQFLWNDLDPNFGIWSAIQETGAWNSPVLGLSCDLSEATDYGDLGVARQILNGIISHCSEIAEFPIGLAVLAKTLFIGKRFCLRHEHGKGYRFFTKRNGWLMGDRITKVILTLAHEIVVISSGLHAARICGDDVIAFSKARGQMEAYLKGLEDLGFQISWEDTFISPYLAFYCEEGCIPPNAYADLPSVALRRKMQSMYIDYPRIRLLIPTCVETRAYSFTDTGRFALLGKEARWVHQNGLPDVIPLFTRAGLLQHLSVPMPADTICPYIPLEIGGDGAFPSDHMFLRNVVRLKARSPSEVCYRMSKLLTAKWGFKFLRSPNLNEVVHKYHLLFPKLEELRALIPRDAIVEGNTVLLNSIRVPGIEDPERTFFRLWRAYYWSTILSTGREPPRLKLSTERGYESAPIGDTSGFSEDSIIRFYLTWRDSGFDFHDVYDYRVLSNRVHVLDYMNMGWNFSQPRRSGSQNVENEPDAASYIVDKRLLNEDNIENFLAHIRGEENLDPMVKDRIYKYVESDSYILMNLEKQRSKSDWVHPRVILLVSGDKRLAVEIKRMLDTKKEPVRVFLCSPQDYIVGHLGLYEDWLRKHVIPVTKSRLLTIEDAGAIQFANACAGESLYTELYNPVIETRTAYYRLDNGVYMLSIKETPLPIGENFLLF